MMRVKLLVHVESADTEAGVAWWADSPDLDGFYAVGDTLQDLRAVALDAIADELGPEFQVVEQLVVGAIPARSDVRQELVTVLA